MQHFETLPGERSASIISSIINLVCPQCGGSMMEFQCNGRCRKNWLPEWEWANFMTMRMSRRGATRARR
jgi:sarcosine oxidase delta subunit